MTSARSVVVTGASSGIGRATALHLCARGWRVFAGVRRDADAEALRSEAGPGGLEPLRLDVVDPASVEAAAGRVAEAVDGAGLHGLVNNAGIVRPGPLEFLASDDLRDQLEVNVVGQVAVTRALLSLLRTARGRIVNVSSMGGYVSTPFLGAYGASKFALEAISDSLRRELRGSGLEVVVVQPGSIDTAIWTKGEQRAEELLARLPERAHALYGEAVRANLDTVRKTAARGIPAERVAQVVERALTARRPRTRYRVGPDAHLSRMLAWLLPDRALDVFVARFAGVHRAQKRARRA